MFVRVLHIPFKLLNLFQSYYVVVLVSQLLNSVMLHNPFVGRSSALALFGTFQLVCCHGNASLVSSGMFLAMNWSLANIQCCSTLW